MKFEEIDKLIDGLTVMITEQGKIMYDYIVGGGVTDVLELGTCYGKSALYMAAALHEVGGGKVTTLDKYHPEPFVGDLALKFGLSEHVNPLVVPEGFNWQLMKFIEEGRKFDFCYIDGPHLWDVDGFAFFLVDKLLNPGGVIIFDDIHWKIEVTRHPKSYEGASEEQRTTKQIKKVFDLLVAQHEDYSTELISSNYGEGRSWTWGWAHKKLNKSDKSA